ncbi:MAG: hypothetical protein HRT61_01410 [Ekhidna sp.]|nr:hypothetical protein [Ekhidna sp.]
MNHSFPTETFQAATGVELFAGQVVKLTTAGLVTPVTEKDAEEVALGVVAGLFYPTADGRPVNTRNIASNVTAGATEHYQGIDFVAGAGVGVRVYIDPTLVYAVKLIDGESFSQAMVGDLVQLTDNDTEANGATVTHTGTVPVTTFTNRTTAGGILRIVEAPRINNTDVAYSTTNITDDNGLVNAIGTPGAIVAVQFEYQHFNNKQVADLAVATVTS